MSLFSSGSEELRIYRGEDYVINEHIVVHTPTLDEICNYGEDEYFSLIHFLAATPTDLCYQLWDLGFDYTTISDYVLFSQLISKMFPPEKTSIIFGRLDFTKFRLKAHPNNKGEIVMEYPNGSWYIDECTYEILVDYLRRVHFLEKNVAIPANESTKMVLIEDARDEALIKSRNHKHSSLLNMISAMVNSEGFKYNHNEVWNLKINVFMDSVMRIGKIKNASLLLQSGYSGFGINLKEVDQKQLNWMGGLY